MHLIDDTTDYQNTSGKTAYVIITFSAGVQTQKRLVRIFSAPTTNSITSATEVFDSQDVLGASSWNSNGNRLTSYVVPIQDNHFIVIQNYTGAAGDIDIPATAGADAIVIEQAP